MSIHNSLRSSAGLARARNVLTRAERVAILSKEGRLQPGDRVTGLPKTKVVKAVRKGKKKKAEETAEAEKAEE